MTMPRIEFIISHEGRPARRVHLEKVVVTIGKKGDNDVVLDEDGISRCHAVLLVQGGGLAIEDRSTNGTFVNAIRVNGTHPLRAGDKIYIGRFSLEASVQGAPAVVDEFLGPVSEPTADPPLVLLDEEPLESASGPTRASPQDLVTDGVLSEGLSLPDTSVEAERRAPTGEPFSLADAYRRLAEQYGALAWGRSPRVASAELPRVMSAAEALLSHEPPTFAHWSHWLAHEICGLDPLSTLLQDPGVLEVVVHGSTSLDVVRIDGRERAARTFSCEEAIHAAYYRLTGADLQRVSIRDFSDGKKSIHAFSRQVAPSGPLLIVRRARPLDDQEPTAFSEPLVRYLRAAQSAGAAILITGGPLADLSAVAMMLVQEIPRSSTITVVQRSGVWSPERAIIVDGYGPTDDVWRCVQRLGRDWLVVEEVGPGEIPYLRACTRHRGGGIITTCRLGPRDSGPGDFAVDLFDILIRVKAQGGGSLAVSSVAELRSREWVELFAEGTDGALAATGESSIL